jgi:lipoprotein-releasing system permease protein
MNLEFFIAKRLITQKSSTGKGVEPAIRIAIIGIAVGLAVMLIAWAIVMGFRREVRNKIIGVNSNIQITSYYSNFSYEMNPVNVPDTLLDDLSRTPGVAHVQRMFTKPGMIKTEDAFQTVVLKGADATYDPTFIRKNLIEGRVPDFSKPTNDVLISEYLSKLLRLKMGDAFLAYFIRGESVSARKFKIAGIYNTHLSEFDKYFLLADARHIRKLNNWNENQAAGLEIFVGSMDQFAQVEEAVYNKISSVADHSEEAFYMRNMYEMSPDLFSWLKLLDTNVWLILLLMIFVSGFNIISGLLILILERTNLIGVLKALGAKNFSVRKVFVYMSCFLIGKGLLWGNLIGLAFCFLQDYFHLLPLNASTYYVDAVPIELNWVYVLLVNVGTVLISLLVVLIPTHMVSRIDPVKAIKFD